MMVPVHTERAAALSGLSARARDELDRTAHPRAPWTSPLTGPGGEHVFDVVIAGAGQGGLAVAHGLQRSCIDNVLVLDRAERGKEGVWVQYARMPTLRSPKEFTGPDLGTPALTYQAWHEAVHGAAHWQALDRIARDDWHRYLGWYRDTLRIAVRNQCELIAIEPLPGIGLALQTRLRTNPGSEPGSDTPAAQTILCRRLVLATGQDGTGRWAVPEPFRALPTAVCRTTEQSIDFNAMRGARVVVIGQGASAADSAACALEHGAHQVSMLVRRPQLQRVQPYLWLTFAGFLRHIGEMPDPWRWRFMNRILGLREAMPQATWDRMARHAAFQLHTNAGVMHAGWVDGKVVLETPSGQFEADYVILGTGIEIDFSARKELAPFADRIATWQDRFEPPAAERNDRLARYPYLSAGASFTAKREEDDAFLNLIHDFTIGSTLSFGPFGCSINAMNSAVPRLVNGITRGLFESDIGQHWSALDAYDEKIFEPIRP